MPESFDKYADPKNWATKKNFVFVADYFADKVTGGAELSTQALIDTCPGNAVCIESKDIGRDDIEKYLDAHWIFTNIWQMKWALAPFIKAKIKKYSIIEYDFKYCVYRSPDMHKVVENIDCNCQNPTLDEYYGNARNVFFMSDQQMRWHIYRIKEIKSAIVLSSIFSNATLMKLAELRENAKEKDCWAIIWSASGLKGFNEAVSYAEHEGINYRVFKDLSYDEMLESLSRCDGLIYKPNGGDTCPRAVIEAKLMGLKLDLNYFVMHKDEDWFKGSVEACWEYLFKTKSSFWSEVCNDII